MKKKNVGWVPAIASILGLAGFVIFSCGIAMGAIKIVYELFKYLFM